MKTGFLRVYDVCNDERNFYVISWKQACPQVNIWEGFSQRGASLEAGLSLASPRHNLVTRFPNHLGSPLLAEQLPKKQRFLNHQYFCREPPNEKKTISMKQERKLSHRDPVVAHLANAFQDFQVLLGNTVFLLFVFSLFVCVLCLETRLSHCLLSYLIFLSCLCNPRRTAQFYPLDQSLRVPYLG